MTLYNKIYEQRYTHIELTAELRTQTDPTLFIVRGFTGDETTGRQEATNLEEAVGQLLGQETPRLQSFTRWLTGRPGRSYLLTTDARLANGTARDDQRVIVLSPFNDNNIR